MANQVVLSAAVAQFYGGVADGEQIAHIVAELGVESRATEPANEEAVTESDSALVRLAPHMP